MALSACPKKYKGIIKEKLKSNAYPGQIFMCSSFIKINTKIKKQNLKNAGITDDYAKKMTWSALMPSMIPKFSEDIDKASAAFKKIEE